MYRDILYFGCQLMQARSREGGGLGSRQELFLQKHLAMARGGAWGEREDGYSEPRQLWHRGEETAEAESTAHHR